MEFKEFPKIPRFSREIIITEKIDGTNASIFIGDNGEFLTGSRNRWVTPIDDNYGFSKWANDNKDELLKLGPGHHFGEWWGQGIQRKYNMKEKVFSLFNVHRWNDETKPSCCSLVPIILDGIDMHSDHIEHALNFLKVNGSVASPGFNRPEGIIIYHKAGNILFKKTLEKDAEPKGFKDPRTSASSSPSEQKEQGEG